MIFFKKIAVKKIYSTWCMKYRYIKIFKTTVLTNAHISGGIK